MGEPSNVRSCWALCALNMQVGYIFFPLIISVLTKGDHIMVSKSRSLDSQSIAWPSRVCSNRNILALLIIVQTLTLVLLVANLANTK